MFYYKGRGIRYYMCIREVVLELKDLVIDESKISVKYR